MRFFCNLIFALIAHMSSRNRLDTISSTKAQILVAKHLMIALVNFFMRVPPYWVSDSMMSIIFLKQAKYHNILNLWLCLAYLADNSEQRRKGLGESSWGWEGPGDRVERRRKRSTGTKNLLVVFSECQSPSSLSHLLSFFLGPYVHYFYNAETKNNDTQLLSFEAFYFSPFLFTLEEKKTLKARG